jgi:hypothetical protein
MVKDYDTAAILITVLSQILLQLVDPNDGNASCLLLLPKHDLNCCFGPLSHVMAL